MLANFVPSSSKGLEPHWLTDNGAAPWPARTTIKRTFRALERWIEDRKGDVSGNEYQIARDALHAVGELDQSNAETMTLIVESARARLMTFIETFKGRGLDAGSPSIVPGTQRQRWRRCWKR